MGRRTTEVAQNEALGRAAIFRDCSRRELKRLSNLGTRVRVLRRRTLTTAGSRGTEAFIILSGTASCFVHGVTVAQFGPGDFFGEVAILDSGPRTATVVSTTDMELLVFNRLEFEVLIKSSPYVAHRMLETMAHRLRQADATAVA